MVQEFGGAEAHTTNNRMELLAVIEALERLQDFQQATLLTDSRYVIDGITKWLSSWRRRGWLTVSGTPVKNRELWQHLARLHHAGIHWQHVRGHRGNPHNERVDTIARAFASGSRPHLFHGQFNASDDPVAAQALRRPPTNPDSLTQRREKTRDAPRYVSIIEGKVAVDDTWPVCAARVRGISGALYKKIYSSQELVAFCTEHGVRRPPNT
jgi:ribonuclease HI